MKITIRKLSCLFAICVGLMPFSGIAWAELPTDWPTFLRNAERNSVNEEATPLDTPLGLRWRQFVDPNENLNIESSPLIVDGKVFIGALANNGPNPTFTDTLYCLDLNTGEILWSYATMGMVWVTPTYHNGKLYVVDWDGYIYRFDVSNPDPSQWTLDWQYRIARNPGDTQNSYWSMRFRASPLIIDDPTHGDKLIILTNEQEFDGGFVFQSSIGKIYCLNPENPTENIWGPLDFGEVYFASPAYSGGVFVVAGYTIVPNGSFGQDAQPTIRGIDVATGAAIWSRELSSQGAISATPTINEGNVYVGTRETENSKIFSLNLYTGNEVWTKPIKIIDIQGLTDYPALYEIWSSPTVAYGNLYFASYKSLYCVSLNDPALYNPFPPKVNPIWSFTPGYLLFGSPAISGGTLYISTDDLSSIGGALPANQTFYALDAGSGQILWQYQGPVGSSQISPAVAEGGVAFASYDASGISGVYCFESGTGQVNQAPILDPVGNKTVDEGNLLTFMIIASDPDGDPLTYSASNLPSGASFVGQTFSWTPNYNQAGSYQVTFSVTDGSLTDEETITITVNNVNRAPVLNSIGNKTVDEGSLLTFTVSATDPDGDTLTYSAFNLPSGATFSNRTFSWTPNYNQAGSYNVTFRVSDGSLIDEETITIAVNNVNAPNAPTNLTARAVSSTQINLSWQDNSNNEAGFKIERGRKHGQNINFTQIATVGANATTYSNTGLSPNTVYYYRVRATNGAGDSGYSNTASAKTFKR